MKLIVAGSRSFDDSTKLATYLYKLTLDLDVAPTIISGAAQGADKLGEEWAKAHGYELIVVPANWDKYGRGAGYRRNEEMAKIATHCICFWDGFSSGTKHMIDIAVRYKLETVVVMFSE